MSNQKNARWLVKSYPEADLSRDNFELVYEDVPEPGDGEVLIKTTSLVISPPLRMAVGTGGITGNVVNLGALMRSISDHRASVANAHSVASLAKRAQSAVLRSTRAPVSCSTVALSPGS